MNETPHSWQTGWYDTDPGPAAPDRPTASPPADAAPHPTQLPPRRAAGPSPDYSGNGRSRRRTGFRIAGICLLAVVIIAASALLFSRDGSAVLNFVVPGRDDGIHEEEYDDFRDFFADYYDSTPGVLSGDSDIPRAEEAGDFSLEPVSEPDAEELSLQEIYAKCYPSVVSITAMVSDTSYLWGTGIVISEDGYIATNAHIIEGAYSATVTLYDDREFEALLVGIDGVSDLAVLKIDAEGLTAAEFCSDQVSVGDSVAAIGNPLGAELRGTLTDGIISAISRDIPYNNHSMTLLQTNAAINDGNSGGPLINMHGQVVGITNMKMKAANASGTGIEGIGFAIPVSTIKNVVDELIATGTVKGRPAIGITVGAMPDSAAEYFDLPKGLYVMDVAPGSDAEAQGIRVGDIVTAINGEGVRQTSDVAAIISQYDVGTIMTFTIYRDGETLQVDVTLMETSDIY
ncbi:MAG: trypsin-like peptidase domain-containing protein [Oscillospiraceae bacterium]